MSNTNCGFFDRKSINSTSGFPIIVEHFEIPVYKGSTLTTEFEFPFNLLNTDTVNIVYGNPVSLNDGEITKISDNAVSVTWSDDIIDGLPSSGSTFRVSVVSADGVVKNYNEITITVF